MAGTNLTALSAILKNQYLGPIREQFNNSTPLLSRLERDDESVVGKNFTIPLHYGRNESVSSRAEGAALAAADSQKYKETIVPMKYHYGSIELTGQTIKACKSDAGAFTRAVESETTGRLSDLKVGINRQLFGDGTGALTACASASTVNITVVSTAKLRVGMPVDILVTATGATTAGVVATSVVSITSATVFVVADAPGTPSSIDGTYSVYLAGSRANEMMGFEGIFSASATLQGLDVATYPWWMANVINGNGAIKEETLQLALDTTEKNSNGSCTAMYTTYGVRRAYMALLQKLKQYTNPLELKGGFQSLDYNGMPMFVDKDCAAGKIYFADEKQMKLFRMSDWEWMEEDGAVLSRKAGYDAYQAILFSYMELGCSMRNAQTVVYGITEA
jgi:hypothetical protein